MSQASERYALALFQIANKHDASEEVEADLREVKKVFVDNPVLLNLLGSPKLSAEKRKNAISELFAQGNEYVVNTLQLLAERRRLEEVADVVDQYISLTNEAKGIEDAKVYSVSPLTEEERASISSTFAKKIGKQSLRIENIIDPSLIGGLRLQIGNRIYDSSISSKLERLQRQLIG
ncbi:F0F1 ATP synthase subunit delta [Planomicrobium chinense]|jgi:F-type H+-transporting ATPase subunit delta|uniref:F0F1 ATP synthase subunit delta n=1 Tax=Planococcus chinensis TaxID=272917 RepID=UPI001CC66146|nr:F0F1 ATP synthase subunit delta [Planococcus chinensis]MBZ5202107.1 F0F1 ATP synthase subunit delta [Planococcus chinensis]MCP2033674.1 F-type H+-transporting ATPase subunit delta [Planomicrobium sp. HSC-17F08]